MGGDDYAPTTAESTAQRMAAFTAQFPDYLKVQLEQIPGMQEALLKASRETTPQVSEIALQNVRDYGPQFANVGADIAAQNAMRQAESDRAVMQGPGRDLIAEARKSAEVYDPEYFKTRELAGEKTAALLNSLPNDMSLSGSERAEIERGLNRSSINRGSVDAPSAIETLNAANQFGGAVQMKRDAMTQALNAANAFMQTAKSGTDTFQVATGKPSVPNFGTGQFSGVQKSPGEGVFGQAPAFMGDIVEMQKAEQARNAGRKTGWDQGMEIWGGINGTISSLRG